MYSIFDIETIKVDCTILNHRENHCRFVNQPMLSPTLINKSSIISLISFCTLRTQMRASVSMHELINIDNESSENSENT